MNFDIVPYKIDETTVIVGVVIYRGSNKYARFVNRVEELQKELTERLKLEAKLKEIEEEVMKYPRYYPKLKAIVERKE